MTARTDRPMATCRIVATNNGRLVMRDSGKMQDANGVGKSVKYILYTFVSPPVRRDADV